MPDSNREIAARWFRDVWIDRRDDNTIDELLTNESLGHMEGGRVTGPTEFKLARNQLLAIFPDLQVKVEGIVAEGANVVTRWSAVATHTGSGSGLKATHRRVAFHGMSWHEIKDGKIVGGWDAWNQGALFESLRTI